MNSYIRTIYISLFLVYSAALQAQTLTTAGVPAQLTIRPAGEHSIRVTLKPLSYPEEFPATPALVERPYTAPVIVLTSLNEPVHKQVGDLFVEVRPNPLTITIASRKGEPIQQLVFRDDNTLGFVLQDAPVLGLGEGGHKPDPGTNWPAQPIEFDRRGRFQEMQPRWQSDAYGSRNPVPLLIGTKGWGLFVAAPWVQVDLSQKDQGVFLPWKPTAKDTVQQNEKNQSGGKWICPSCLFISGQAPLFLSILFANIPGSR